MGRIDNANNNNGDDCRSSIELCYVVKFCSLYIVFGGFHRILRTILKLDCELYLDK